MCILAAGEQIPSSQKTTKYFSTKSLLNQYGFTAYNTVFVPNPLKYKSVNFSNRNYQERNKHSTLT